jgi:hypothetical protein
MRYLRSNWELVCRTRSCRRIGTQVGDAEKDVSTCKLVLHVGSNAGGTAMELLVIASSPAEWCFLRGMTAVSTFIKTLLNLLVAFYDTQGVRWQYSGWNTSIQGITHKVYYPERSDASKYDSELIVKFINDIFTTSFYVKMI